MTIYAFCIAQRATAQSKKSFFYRARDSAEVPPAIQAGLPNCAYFFLFLCSFNSLIWNFRVSFCTYSSVLGLRPDVLSGGIFVSFVALGPLNSQKARHRLRSAAMSRHLAISLGRSLL
jgi:hypothetical protein